MIFTNYFDIIIIGGGHAGIEAANIAEKMNLTILLLTDNINTIGEMACNPSIGGVGKGHLVKEIDALGGLMGYIADKSGIQFRILNSSKGAAVQSTRVQVDKNLYKKYIQNKLENKKNLCIIQQTVKDLLIKNYKIIGVITKTNIVYKSKIVILTTGTFLNNKIYIGNKNYYINKNFINEINLSKTLEYFNLIKKRLKTGTPPRIDGKSINFSILKKQYGETDPIPFFSILSNKKNINIPQTYCWLTKTNYKTHKIIKNNIKKSAIFNGMIKSLGPRYCPSIEDKINKFKNKKSHKIYLEPESLTNNIFYPNGISTSLPLNIQIDFIKSIKGLENVNILTPGYAIEYDYFEPHHLKLSLETKNINNLFFAGQINGTTGYEEAAAQGLIAGLNACLKIKNKKSWTPKRNIAYIGVLIDDLITQDIKEPYRIFTSKAEYRLNLREDNVYYRLIKYANKFKCIKKKQSILIKKNKKKIKNEINKLKFTWIKSKEINNILYKNIFKKKKYNLYNLLKRNNINYYYILKNINFNNKKIYLSNIEDINIFNYINIYIKYKGYIKRQKKEIFLKKNYKNFKLPNNINYMNINSISIEAKQKLNKYKPKNLYQASKILGVTPSTLSILYFYIKKNK